MVSENIAISDLTAVIYCPIKYYRDYRAPHTVVIPDSTSICKHIACAHPDSDPDALWEELTFIHPELDPDSKTLLTTYLDVYNNALQQPWTEQDLYVSSKKWGISGIIDKYHAPTHQITLVKGTKAPQTGVYRSDKVRALGYMICVQEMMNIKHPVCVVEYIPSGIIRTISITPHDRRLFIETLKQVRRIRSGHVPHRPVRAPCQFCVYKDDCTEDVSEKRLSRLFRFR